MIAIFIDPSSVLLGSSLKCRIVADEFFSWQGNEEKNYFQPEGPSPPPFKTPRQARNLSTGAYREGEVYSVLLHTVFPQESHPVEVWICPVISNFTTGANYQLLEGGGVRKRKSMYFFMLL